MLLGSLAQELHRVESWFFKQGKKKLVEIGQSTWYLNITCILQVTLLTKYFSLQHFSAGTSWQYDHAGDFGYQQQPNIR